jgi:hypothetical protein
LQLDGDYRLRGQGGEEIGTRNKPDLQRGPGRAGD